MNQQVVLILLLVLYLGTPMLIVFCKAMKILPLSAECSTLKTLIRYF